MKLDELVEQFMVVNNGVSVFDITLLKDIGIKDEY